MRHQGAPLLSDDGLKVAMKVHVPSWLRMTIFLSTTEEHMKLAALLLFPFETASPLRVVGVDWQKIVAVTAAEGGEVGLR